jgi:hypothetical protein
MATYFFVGDGTEVLACEAYEANARAEMKRLQEEQPENADAMSVYSADVNEITFDNGGKPHWAYPSERTLAAESYDLPTMDEVTKPSPGPAQSH